MDKIDGKQIASEIIAELKEKPVPNRFLAAFLVGDDSASTSFVRQKEKTAKELGIDFRVYKYPEEISNDKLRREVSKIVLGKKCGGAIVQLPLPEHLNKHYILNVIPREKDVDVLGERALGAFYAGRNPVLPPAVGTIIKILSHTWSDLPQGRGEALGGEAGLVSEGAASRERRAASAAGAEERLVLSGLAAKRVAIVGLGLLVGKPISVWLKGRVKELYLLDEKSDLSILKQADLVISGVGKAGIIKPEMLKENAGIIDFGYDEHGESLAGDFDSNALKARAANEAKSFKLNFYTPTPGGTGPILVAQLVENFYNL